MPILVACPTCGYQRQVDEREACLGIKCPKCYQSFLDAVVKGPGQNQDNAEQASLKKRLGSAAAGRKKLLRTIGVIALMFLGFGMAAYGGLGSLFVAAAVNKPGENVGWGSVLALILFAAFGLALGALGIRLAMAKKPASSLNSEDRVTGDLK